MWWWSSSVDDVILVSIELNSTSVLWCHPSSCLNPSRFWVVDGKLLFIHLINSSTLPPFHLSISLTSLSSHLLDFNQQSLFKNVIMPSCQFLSHHHHLLPLLLLLPGLLPFPSSSPKKTSNVDLLSLNQSSIYCTTFRNTCTQWSQTKQKPTTGGCPDVELESGEVRKCECEVSTHQKKTINQSFLSSISLSLKKKTLNGFYLLHSLNSLIPLDPDRLLKPCSSGNLADCSCNKATGCACSSSVTTHQTLVILQSTHRDIYDLLLLLCLPIYSCSDIFDIIGSDHDDSKGKSYNSIRQSSLSLSTWYLRLCQLSLQGFFKVGERRDWRS